MFDRKLTAFNGLSSLFKVSLVCLILFNLTSCSGDDDDLIGNWVYNYNLSANSRIDPVAATVGDTIVYLGTGYDDDDRLSDWWSYNGRKSVQLADFPGTARSNAVAFSIDGKIYVGLGYDGSDRLGDFWCYTPSTDSWTQIEDFPGTPREGAVAFSLDGIGYVGTGYDEDKNYMKDFYAYDPSTGEWSQSDDITGSSRTNAVVFKIDDAAYVCTGVNNSTLVDDFWKFTTADGWTHLRNIADDDDDASYDDDYDNITGQSKVAFVMNGKGYVCTGSIHGSSATTGSAYTWEYDPSTDLWTEKTELEGSDRAGAIGFTINDYGYVAMGGSSSTVFNDMFYFQPNAEQDDSDNLNGADY